MDYDEFVKQKALRAPTCGFDVNDNDLNPWLMDFQRAVTRWALRCGRAAIFADCGLGKGIMHLEWASQVAKHESAPVLILAPLAVSYQTMIESNKFGIELNLARDGGDVLDGVNITNYEKMHKFDPSVFAGIAIDESSILKAYTGKMRSDITSFARHTPFRLSASATPAPNDLVELINQAEFLGVATEQEIKGMFFTQDGNSSNKFRLKRHAIQEFWKWVSSWAIAFRNPGDIGFQNEDFVLPELNINHIQVKGERFDNGMLFDMDAVTLDEQRRVRKNTIQSRVDEAARLVNESSERWIIWCDLNDESIAASRAIGDSIEVTGSQTPEEKERRLIGFTNGDHRVLVSKPSICGFGMNWQHCQNVIFLGLSHSFEKYYQAIRRVWRFGQRQDVNVFIITSSMESNVVENIKRKERQSMDMYDQIVHFMDPESNLYKVEDYAFDYQEDVAKGRDWTLYLGDSVKTIDRIDSESVGLSIFSPPFPGMYVYTNSPADMGNVRDMEHMIDQFRYLMDRDKLYRVMMPGRNVFIHITQGVAQKGRDGYMGIKDFRGKIIQMMTDIGWNHYGEITIDKNPQNKASRTKDHGLMFSSLARDSARMHPALSDMLLQFRKPGDNPHPIKSGKIKRYGSNGWVIDIEWINWARPVWYAADYEPGTWKHDYTGDPFPDGIKETDVLNVRQARETNDERHLCPLQLGVIDRVVKIWSNPDDVVYSPFAGIGSEGYSAIRLGRKFVGCELKKSYWDSAIQNLKMASQSSGMSLLDYIESHDS